MSQPLTQKIVLLFPLGNNLQCLGMNQLEEKEKNEALDALDGEENDCENNHDCIAVDKV